MSDSKAMPACPPERIDYRRVGLRRTAWIALTSYAPVVAVIWFFASLTFQQNGVHERRPLDLAAGGRTRITFVSPRDERLCVRVTQNHALNPPHMPQAFSLLSCQITADGEPVPLSGLTVGESAPWDSGRLDLAEFAVRKGQSCEVEVTTLQSLYSYASDKPQLRIVSVGGEDEPFPFFRFVTIIALIIFPNIALKIFRERMRAAQRRIG